MSTENANFNGDHDGKLLSEDGDITEEFERCLSYIFAKYCTPSVVPPFSILTITPKTAVMTEEALDQWAIDTNGEAFSADTKEELGQYMDMNDEGHLTLVMILSFYGDVIDKPDRFKGFLQIYVLQTENDEEETFRDLAKHGFDRNLQRVKLNP